MIGDRLLITDNSRKKAKKILDILKEEKIILIYGISGTEKSETSDCLQELLFKRKKQSICISLDDYYLVHPTIRDFNRKKQGIESVGLSEIDWTNLEQICSDFINKKSIKIKRTHRYADIIERLILETKDIDYLIIEGLYAGWLKKFGYGNLVIYLEGTPQQTFKFRQLRGKEDEDDEFRKKIVQKECNVIYQLKRYADIILPYDNTY